VFRIDFMILLLDLDYFDCLLLFSSERWRKAESRCVEFEKFGTLLRLLQCQQQVSKFVIYIWILLLDLVYEYMYENDRLLCFFNRRR